MGSIIDKQYRATIFRDWSYIAHVSSFVDVSRSSKFLYMPMLNNALLQFAYARVVSA
jgi:hypothetical protein